MRGMPAVALRYVLYGEPSVREAFVIYYMTCVDCRRDYTSFGRNRRRCVECARIRKKEMERRLRLTRKRKRLK